MEVLIDEIMSSEDIDLNNINKKENLKINSLKDAENEINTLYKKMNRLRKKLKKVNKLYQIGISSYKN